MSFRFVPWFVVGFLAALGCDASPRPDAGVSDAGGGVDASRPGDASPVDGGLGGCELDLEAHRASGCFCEGACDCFLDLPYGDALWTERGEELAQAVDVFLPRGAGGAAVPLVVFAHANGVTKSFGPGSSLARDVALPLLAAGVAFASVEFRHPAANADIDAPRTDLAHAIQYLRCNAATLGTSRPRMAGVARSRGALMIWTAVQDDLADPTSADPARRESTRLRGVYGAQAQTSYRAEWVADTFFAEADREAVIARFGAADHGHAVGDVTADDPPIALAYRGALASLPLQISDCTGAVDCTHLPNFGDALAEAYEDAGIGSRVSVQYEVSDDALFVGAADRLQGWLAP